MSMDYTLIYSALGLFRLVMKYIQVEKEDSKNAKFTIVEDLSDDRRNPDVSVDILVLEEDKGQLQELLDRAEELKFQRQPTLSRHLGKLSLAAA